jgi:hypothetical protein
MPMQVAICYLEDQNGRLSLLGAGFAVGLPGEGQGKHPAESSSYFQLFIAVRLF